MFAKFRRKVARNLPRTWRASLAKLSAELGSPVFPIPIRSEPTFEAWSQAARNASRYSVRRIEAHPLEALRRTPPDLHLEPTVHAAFTSEFQRESPPTFVLKIPAGRVWGDVGNVLMPDGAVLREMSPDFHDSWKKDKIFRQSHLTIPEQRRGRILSLASPGGQTFGHWLFDVLPRLAILEKAGLSLEDCDGVFLSETRKKFQSETLELLGIPREKWISAEDTIHLQAETLIATSPVGLSGNYPKWVIDWLREKFLSHAKPVPFVSRRILISRAKAPGRRIANEDALAAALEPDGFQRILIEDYTFTEQISIMANAEFVIGPMGSSTSAAVFCNPQTPFIETYSSNAVNVFTWAFGTCLPLRFGYLLGTPIPNPNSRPHDYNYYIDPEKLRTLIARCAPLKFC